MAGGGDGGSRGSGGVTEGEARGFEGPRWLELGEVDGAIKAGESKFGTYPVGEIFPARVA